MKKFALFILKFILILGVTYGAYYGIFWLLWQWNLGPNAYDNAYQKALLLQIEALSDENREPEIIVFGSSYVPFGIDTAVMEERLNTPVQILGVEASIGIPFLVETLYDTAKPGDTIVYMLGKSNWFNEDFMVISAALESNKDLLLNYWNRRPGMVDNFRNKLIWRKMYALFAANGVEFVRSHLSEKEQVYALSSFDENGNMVVLREGNQIGTDVSPTDTFCMADLETETLDLLNEFSLWCKDNDITFVIAYGMMIDGALVETDESLAEFHQELSDYMEADILGIPQDYFLDIHYYYNHPAHLNSEGAAIYSEILSNKLLEYGF